MNGRVLWVEVVVVKEDSLQTRVDKRGKSSKE